MSLIHHGRSTPNQFFDPFSTPQGLTFKAAFPTAEDSVRFGKMSEQALGKRFENDEKILNYIQQLNTQSRKNTWTGIGALVTGVLLSPVLNLVSLGLGLIGFIGFLGLGTLNEHESQRLQLKHHQKILIHSAKGVIKDTPDSKNLALALLKDYQLLKSPTNLQYVRFWHKAGKALHTLSNKPGILSPMNQPELLMLLKTLPHIKPRPGFYRQTDYSVQASRELLLTASAILVENETNQPSQVRSQYLSNSTFSNHLTFQETGGSSSCRNNQADCRDKNLFSFFEESFH
jgi:hypothetical protein